MNQPNNDANTLSEIEAYGLKLAEEAIEQFWPDRPEHPELNGNGVKREELSEKVQLDMRAHIGRTRGEIIALITGAQDHERAFRGIEEMLTSTALVSATRSYEAIVFEKKAGIDELTGLPTIRVFRRSLAAAIESNKRFGHTFSLVFFDLDRFKRVNDEHGHQAGDAVLVEMARRLSEDGKLRGVDSLARYGGEEFVAILPETPKEGAAIMAKRISDQIGKKPFTVEDKQGNEIQLDVSASIGIAEYTTADEDSDGSRMINRADESLYVLKGEAPDADGFTDDRRGQIACDSQVLTELDIEAFRAAMRERGKRTSLPPRN